MTTIEQTNVNYKATTSNEVYTLEANFSIANNVIDSFTASIYKTDGTYIGNSSYSEFQEVSNYSYSLPDNLYKADVINLVDLTIVDIKTELIEE